MCISFLLAMTKCLTEGILERKGLFGSQYNWIQPILVEKVWQQGLKAVGHIPSANSMQRAGAQFVLPPLLGPGPQPCNGTTYTEDALPASVRSDNPSQTHLGIHFHGEFVLFCF